MEAVRSFETSWNTYLTAQRYITEHATTQHRHCDNLKTNDKKLSLCDCLDEWELLKENLGLNEYWEYYGPGNS